MNLSKEEQLISKRFLDLARIADTKYISTYTDFLNINEQSLFYNVIKELPLINYTFYGGYDSAERCILGFYNEQYEFPITCIKIGPKNLKFAKELTHRDYLGALISLGIDRSKLGDIIIDDNFAYLFCHTSIADYIIDNLHIIKHTNVVAQLFDLQDFKFEPKFKELQANVSSVRLDSILAVAFNISRSKVTEYISKGKVFINGRNIISNNYNLKEKDVISLRGMGKFSFEGVNYTTKKGRLSITIYIYT